MGYIYKITNSINKKIYIGKTVRTVPVRFKEHLDRADENYQSYLYNAIRKYGQENFIVETIEEVNDEDINEKEKYWIHFYQSNLKENGYNLTIGGDGNQTIDWKEIYYLWDEGKSIKKISLILNISTTAVSRALSKYKNYSEKESLKRGYKEQGIAVNQYSLDGKYIKTYDSYIDAANGNPTIAHSIGQCCNGKLQTANGYQWKNCKNNKDDIAPATNYKLKTRKVKQFSLDGIYIQTFNSLIEAARSLTEESKARITANQIQQVCKHNRKTAKGYIWEYEQL